jgi:hypothetical protein
MPGTDDILQHCRVGRVAGVNARIDPAVDPPRKGTEWCRELRRARLGIDNWALVAIAELS